VTTLTLGWRRRNTSSIRQLQDRASTGGDSASLTARSAHGAAFALPQPHVHDLALAAWAVRPHRGAKRAAEAARRRGAGRSVATKISPEAQNVDARCLADLYVRSHDLDHAIATYRDLLALDPANLRGKVGLARALRWSQRYGDAERLYGEILAVAPDDRDAIEGLAQTYALAGDFPTALTLLDRGSARLPEDTDLLTLKGTVLAWQGRYAEGLAWIEKALVLSPDSAYSGTLATSACGRASTSAAKAHRAGADGRTRHRARPAAAYEAAGREPRRERVKETCGRRPTTEGERLQGSVDDAGLASSGASGSRRPPMPACRSWPSRSSPTRLVRRRPNLHRFIYYLLLALALAWMTPFCRARRGARLLEPRDLIVVSRDWPSPRATGRRAAGDLNATGSPLARIPTTSSWARVACSRVSRTKARASGVS
jgi:tetratricopeptide (TPR) repeat protein